ncbi:MAG TPA: AAA family ATPase, partial [Mycobacteriales bacterium]|nr:AAA family ATPase [Mycobacteriales bacterium]
VETNKSRSNETVASRIAQTYQWVLVPEQPDPQRPSQITVERAESATERLAERATERLIRAGQLAGAVAARTIRLDLDQKLGSLWSRGYISVGELWSYYCRYPFLTRLRDRSVLDDGVRSALDSLTWTMDGFALADSFDEATGRFTGLTVPGPTARFGEISDRTLLVHPDVAAKNEADGTTDDSGATSGGSEPEPGDGLRDLPPTPQVPAAKTRFFGVYEVDPERYGRDLTKLSQEILQQLASLDGVALDVTVEIQARRPEGFPDDKIRVVLENARTLRFSQSSFEDE